MRRWSSVVLLTPRGAGPQHLPDSYFAVFAVELSNALGDPFGIQ